MTKILSVLALLLALAMPSYAVTETSAGGPVNISYVLDYPASSAASCALISPSSHTPTVALAAPARQRVAMWFQNVSTITLGGSSNAGNAETWATSSKVPEIALTATASFGAAGTVGVGPLAVNFRMIPALFVLGGINPILSTGYVDTAKMLSAGLASGFQMSGAGIPQGAIYATSQANSATANVVGKLMACELLAQ